MKDGHLQPHCHPVGFPQIQLELIHGLIQHYVLIQVLRLHLYYPWILQG